METLAVGIAFLLGSIPFSWILVRLLRGVDLRTVGSGNPGATNAWRVVGWRWGTVALLLDIGKGLASVLAVPEVAPIPSPLWLPTACGCAAILGNVFCPFLGFRGGKAVATASGVFLGLTPVAFFLTFLLFALIVWRTRKISIGSLTGALVLPILLTFEWLAQKGDSPDPSVIMLVWAAAILVAIRHSANIKRLVRREETTFLKTNEE